MNWIAFLDGVASVALVVSNLAAIVVCWLGYRQGKRSTADKAPFLDGRSSTADHRR
jgi:hypothetical protein